MSQFPLIGMTAFEKVVRKNPLATMAGITTTYKDAVLAAGGIPLILPINLEKEQIDALWPKLDGILMPGGGDIEPWRYGDKSVHELTGNISAQRDEFELYVTRKAVDDNKPLLAICRGHQVLNVAMGGTLWQDVRTEIDGVKKHDYYQAGMDRAALPHDVQIRPNSLLAELLGATKSDVNSLHHQGVKELGDGLVVSAESPDGIIEGIEIPNHRFAVGVQWHPEELVSTVESMQGLFTGLIEAV